MALLGGAIVILALLFMSWPPDYDNPFPYENVSHWARMTGNDAPDGRAVARPSFYAVRRGLDALAYYMVFQSLVAIVGLAVVNDRNMYVLLIISGVYGIVYGGALGIALAPLTVAIGYAFILWAGIFGFYATATGPTKKQSQFQAL